MLGWLNWCSSASPTKLYHGGQIITSPARLAEIMNNFFVDKVTTIRQGLPTPTDNPLKTLQNMMKGRTTMFSLSCVHPDAVRKIILGLKNSKSSGVDNIDTYVIKLIKLDILPALTHVINLSIYSQEFPLYWKRSKIIPLHKKEDLLNPKNYRPMFR